MNEKIKLDMLIVDSVSVKRQEYDTFDGKEQQIGKPWRRAYTNSEIGRSSVIAELPQDEQISIFSIWGDFPTVDILPYIAYTIDKNIIAIGEIATITVLLPVTAVVDSVEYPIDSTLEYSNDNVGTHSIILKADQYKDTYIEVTVE